MDDHRYAQSNGFLKKRLKCYAHSRLLIIEELGHLDIDEGGADLLFQLVGIGGWARVFGDEVAASAIADRVRHRCHLVKITGRSYRLKDLPVEKWREG